MEHLPTKMALRKIAGDCIEKGDDDEFVEAMLEERGFLVFSRAAIWSVVAELVRTAQNLEFFPSGRDSDQFVQVFETNGTQGARLWLSSRFKISEQKHTEGGYQQRVLYLPVESKLEKAFEPEVRPERGRETVELTEW